MKQLFPIALLAMALFPSCKEQENRGISLAKCEFVTEFPASSELTELDDKRFDEIGVRSIKVVDTLIILSMDDSWAVYGESGKNYGHCLSIGQGPGEFSPFCMPRSSASGYRVYGDSLYAFLSANPEREIRRINLTRFVEDSIVDVRTQIKTDVLSTTMWQISPCDSSTFIMAMPEGNYTSFSRKIYRDGQVSEIPGTESLSSARVKGEEAINVLCKVQCYEPTCDMVVEAMGELNQLNIYSPAGERAKTVCVGKMLDDPAEVEALPMSDRVMTYNNGCTFKEGFGAIYIGKSDREARDATDRSSDLQFFDWDGKPVFRTRLPYKLYDMDIDFRNNRLYVIDSENDCIRTYDATPIIKAYKK